MNISIVIPLYNEEESLNELYAWIKRVMNNHKFSYEVIFVDDGSTDKSWQVIEQLQEKHNEVKGIKFRRNYGKSPALYFGFNGHKVMSLSQWMPICKIVPMKYQNFTE